MKKLGLILAKFDPFIAEHIKAHANKGKKHTSYLSKTICEEFMSLIGSRVHDTITCELKNSKYYTISLDSTPDVLNVNQLTLIVGNIMFYLLDQQKDLLSFGIWIVIMLSIYRINC